MLAQGKVTIDRNEIRMWASARQGCPALVKKMTSAGNELAISIVFPNFTKHNLVRELSWEEFFEKFDQQQLVFVYQEEDSNHNLSHYFEFL